MNSNIKTISESGGYISRLIFNNNKEIEINENDIVIFVGPNNAGKSQGLKDIYELSRSKKPTIVVRDLEIIKRDGKLEDLLDKVSVITDNGEYKNYAGFGYNFSSHAISGYENDKYYGSARSLFVAYLDTLNRLGICEPAPLIARKAVKKNPIHYVAFDRNYREWLGSNFKKAFGKELIPHMQNGINIPLCIGEAVKFEKNFADEQMRQEEYADILDTYKQVQDQGDGVKSFTGILLYLMLDYYCTFLIDEPESFLHPPQANMMGRIIGETLRENQQAFISTHSEDIIKGLLDVCPERVKIIRITRKENVNSFSVLESNKFKEIWSDPLLKYSNIMTSLFHNEVVLCESDSDCKMYSIIECHLQQELGKYSETLFVHCNGKHRMARIARALKTLDIQVKLIPDIDVLNEENIFRGIAEACGIEWQSISKEYRIIVSNLHSRKEVINKKDFQKEVSDILSSSTNQELSTKEIRDLCLALRTESKWETLKQGGVAALPSGDATVAFSNLNKTLKEAGIYLVTVGQLERFIKQVGGHGPDWTNDVLETYQDLDDEVYDEIKKFIKEVCGLY
ncbi:MAG: AAA family ATPase [Lachnospiraceae bacterium]|nr:AAA family ATPase [Lachnospiraceae bacterium]